MVAGDSPRMCRRAIAREPTGSAVFTYSAMTAINTSRPRLSRATPFMTADCNSQELGKDRVGHQESGLGEARAATVLDEEPALSPRRPQLGQATGLEADPLVEPGARDAVGRAKSEEQALAEALPRREDLVGAERWLPRLDERAVTLHRLHVGVARRPEIPAGPRP